MTAAKNKKVEDGLGEGEKRIGCPYMFFKKKRNIFY
jgi:hypothetical protein